MLSFVDKQQDTSIPITIIPWRESEDRPVRDLIPMNLLESEQTNLFEQKFDNILNIEDFRPVFREKDTSIAKMSIQPKEQVEFLRKDIGFNISELSSILHISRPTVYEWIDSESPNIQTENQIRLNEIYDVCAKWKETNLGRIGNNLRRIMYQDKSLFDLLKEENLDRTSISEIFSLLKEIMQKNQDRKNKHEAFIKKHGLEEESKKRRKVAVSMHRSIG